MQEMMPFDGSLSPHHADRPRAGSGLTTNESPHCAVHSPAGFIEQRQDRMLGPLDRGAHTWQFLPSDERRIDTEQGRVADPCPPVHDALSNVHVFYVRLDEMLAGATALLDGDEHARAARFVFERDR